MVFETFGLDAFSPPEPRREAAVDPSSTDFELFFMECVDDHLNLKGDLCHDESQPLTTIF